MDSNKPSKEWCLREKYEIGKAIEKDKVSYFHELEEGEFRRDESFGSKSLVHKDMDTGMAKLSSSAQVTVKRQSIPRERGTRPGETANTTVEQSDYSTLEDQSLNSRQPTFHRKNSEKRCQSYSLSFHISSKERRKQRKQNCFQRHEYHRVLEKIEKVCSERLSKLVLQQNEDRKEFNILQKKQELEFFREHVHSYKVLYERVIPTVQYDRIKLPKLLFCTLSKIFHKHIQTQLIKFVKQQINDRNKEKRMKERWIFEAKAGYLKKYFDETSLTYSEFEMGKSKCHMNDYSEGEQQLKYLDMQSLSSAIEAIASSNEVANSNTSKNIDVSDPILENLQSPLKTNGGTKHGLSVAAADEIATVDSAPSQSNCASAVQLVEKVGTQVACSQPPQNKGESVGRSCSSIEDMDGTLEITKAMSADSGNTLPVSKEKRRRTSAGGDASEGSCSRSERNLPHESVNNFHETSLNHEEPQAARLPSVNANQRERPGTDNRKVVSGDQTSSLAQVTDQRNINANLSALTNSSKQLQHCDHTGQNATYPYQQSDRTFCSVRTGLDSPGPSNIQEQRTNQMMTGSTVEQCTPEVRLQSDPTTIELNQVLMPCRDHTSSFSQVTELRNINACSSSLTQPVTQQPHRDQTCQTVAHQYQPSGGSTTLLRTWLDSPGESNVQRQSANQTTTGSTSEHMLESGLQSDPLTIELNRLLMLRDLMTKKHLSEKQKLILECEMEVAELKKKYDDLFHNLEMETLQKKKDVQILQEKVCKQQILAEAFQVAQASAGVVSCSQRGAPSRTINVPNQSSGQQTLLFPTSATMNQPPQPAVPSSTHQLLRQPGMITQEGAMNTSGRSAATLTSTPRGVMDARIAYRGPAPHLRAFLNPLAASRHGAASFER